MKKNIEVFENEEAEKFLNYFIAFKKLTSLMDNAKCMAAVNSEISLNRLEPTSEIIPKELSDPNALLPI